MRKQLENNHENTNIIFCIKLYNIKEQALANYSKTRSFIFIITDLAILPITYDYEPR